MSLRLELSTVLAALLAALPAARGQSSRPASAPDLPFPGLLQQAAREAGNPLATYAAMLGLDARYRESKVLAGIYPEVRSNYEEFLGLPLAGVAAMSLPPFRTAHAGGETPIPDGFVATAAVSAIAAAAARTRLVIYGEEHHLPQTRSLYEPLLRALWPLGYRYLAAETFAEEVMAPGFAGPRYTSGYYLMDPVFAAAVRTARSLGYRLIAYETRERGPAGDGSFRDRTQAETLERRTFAVDPQARVLVIAGRGHAAEVPPPDGWTPMASVLKQRTGIDPFTVFAPTMGQRQTVGEEHPLYRFATGHGLLTGPTIFVGKDGACLGSGNCDAYVFWPRITLVGGRPDWLVTTLGRTATPIPAELRVGKGLRLVQAFPEGEPDAAVPADQILVREGEPWPVLMLPPGVFRVRTLDAQGQLAGPVRVQV